MRRHFSCHMVVLAVLCALSRGAHPQSAVVGTNGLATASAVVDTESATGSVAGATATNVSPGSAETASRLNLATNMIPLSDIPSDLRDVAHAWPAMPPDPAAVIGDVAKVPRHHRLYSPVSPPGMRLVSSRAFDFSCSMIKSNCTASTPGCTVDLYIDMFEVTRGLWNSVVGSAAVNGYGDLPASPTNSSGTCGADLPMADISWHDCIKWCNARSEREGLVPVYYTDRKQVTVYRTGTVDVTAISVDWNATGYRLPTEMEWETASRGGLTGAMYPWGNDLPDGSKANYWNSGDPFDNGPTPVGYYNGRQRCVGFDGKVRGMVNGYGLWDMAGNVAEWCWDSYDSQPSEDIPRGAALDGSGVLKVVRGGSWRSASEHKLLCAYRGYASANARMDCLGLRTVIKR